MRSGRQDLGLHGSKRSIVVTLFNAIVCHAHAAWACFPVKTHVHEDVDMAHFCQMEALPNRGAWQFVTTGVRLA